MSKDFDTSVLIAGAGPVGLALAVELGLRGIPCLLVEKRDGTSHVPKMSEVATRIMEFCRRWGIANEVRHAVWKDRAPSDFVYVENMTGRELARQVHNAPTREQHGHYTPERAAMCPQIYFDPILARLAARQPSVSISYNTALESFAQDEAGVTAMLRGADGSTRQVRARYLVGCDGASSIVRESLGIGLDGLGVIAHSVSLFFDAPGLIQQHGKGFARIYRLIDEAGCWAEMITINSEGLYRLTIFNEPQSLHEPDRYLRRMFGGPFAYRLLNASEWARSDFVAGAFGKGRVLLAGDAVQQVSPTGGIGMATGVEEAVNLAWKLAAVLQGWGGPRLLDSYTAERRPNAVRNVALSTRTYQTISTIPGHTPGQSDEKYAASMDAWRANLGQYDVADYVKVQFTYEDSPICVPDGTPPFDPEPKAFIPSARPGARAPHIWLDEDKTIFDYFDEGFTLLRMGAKPPSGQPLLDAARQRGLPIKEAVIDNAAAAAMYEQPLVLIRPDGHVAWRGPAVPADPFAIVDRIRGA